jgi:thermitase
MRIASLAPGSNFRAALICAAALVAASILPPQTREAFAQRPPAATDRLILQVRPGATDHAVQDEVALHGGRVVARLNRLGMVVAKLPPGQARRVRKLLARSKRFKSVELDSWREPSFVPDDTYVPQAWHLGVLELFGAWDMTTGSPTAPIAILDSGVDPDHPDLAAKLVPGWNFYNNNADTSDVYGHGTKVAGAAAAMGNNGVGVVGPAYANPIMPIRVTNTDGWALDSAIINGLTWAADHGARVANISFAGVHQSSAIQAAAQYFTSKGGLVVASAGNYGNDDGSPDNPYVVSVSATSSADTITSWSSFGSYVDVAAPGSGIYTTTDGGGYATASGTSFSAPITAGVIALILAANPDLTPQEAEQVLEGNADDLGAPGFDIEYGWGRVNALNAVMAAAASGDPGPDTIEPAVALTAPLGGATLSGSVTVFADASDNVAVTEVRFYADGQLLGTDATQPYSALWDTAAAPDGPHTLLAEAYDEAGNRGSSAPVSVTVDNAVDTEAPTVGITDPVEGDTVSGEVTVAAAANDNVGVTLVRFYADDVPIGDDNSEPYAILVDAAGATSGPHTLKAEAFDAAGNRGDSTPVSVTVGSPPDTTPPTVAITNPADGDLISAGVSVAASATDDTAVTEVRFYVDGVLLATDTAAPYSALWDASAAGDGPHVLHAEASDQAGNLGRSASVSVTVGSPADTTPPTVAITDPADGDLLSAVVSVAASATDDTAVTEVRFFVDGALLATDTAAPYSAFWDTSAAADGPHLLHAAAFDAAGNRGDSADVSVTVDNPEDPGAPLVSFTAPLDGTLVNKNKVVFTVDASSPVGLLYVELLVDGVPHKADKRPPYVLAENAKRWTEGPHLITARALGADGKIGEASLTVVKVASESKKKKEKKKKQQQKKEKNKNQ